MQTSVHLILDFLPDMFHKGMGFSAINTTKFAVLNFQLTVGDKFEKDDF